MKLSKRQITFFFIVVSVVLLLGIKLILHLLRPTYNEQVILARSEGNPSAPIKVIEYTDFQCPACSKGTMMIKRYLQAYPSKIFLQFRHFPLSMHRHALEAHMYAQCAAEQDKFWPYEDLLFEQQKEWRDLQDADPYFQKLARQVGLNLKALNVCLDKQEAKSAIFQDKAEGDDLGVDSTPTYFLNGKMIVGQKNLEEEFKRILEIKKD